MVGWGGGGGGEMMEIAKGKRENQVLFKSVTPAKTDTQRLMDAENKAENEWSGKTEWFKTLNTDFGHF